MSTCLSASITVDNAASGGKPDPGHRRVSMIAAWSRRLVWSQSPARPTMRIVASAANGHLINTPAPGALMTPGSTCFKDRIILFVILGEGQHWEMSRSLHPSLSSLRRQSQQVLHAPPKPRSFRLPFYYSSVRLQFQASGWEQVAGVQALVDSLFSKVLPSTAGRVFPLAELHTCRTGHNKLIFILTPTSEHLDIAATTTAKH